MADYGKALEISPQSPAVYYSRGHAKIEPSLSIRNPWDNQGACDDFKAAASIGDQCKAPCLHSEDGNWYRNMR